jgi:predicted class III extradiol MEMO1 family dioxygenase
MAKFIRINKKKIAIEEQVVSEWALKALVDKAKVNQMTVEQMVVQSIANHWMQNDKFRKSDSEVLNTLLSLAYDFGYDVFKIANGKIKVMALDEERRAAVAPGDMEL